MPGPRAAPNLPMPHPRTDKAHKCPAVARGGMGAAGIDRCINVVQYINIIFTVSFSETNLNLFNMLPAFQIVRGKLSKRWHVCGSVGAFI